IELIEEKRQAQRDRIIRAFDGEPEIQILKGRWGPFISYKGRNLRIPKDREPASLTLEEIHAIAEATPDVPRKGGFRRFGAKKTTEKETPLKKAAAAKPVARKAKAPAKKAAVKKAAPVKKAAAPKKAAAKKAPAKKAAVKKK
ncbi:MAG TPA: topoisomerase C-terminal repeat-containing protein, partial [Bacteroidia bacterium]|nr:topoisomerase C-terminal repeat-containing protein [Bacteroidia bacterium]